MHDPAHTLLGLSSRTSGILGDSLTFFAAFLLALEALFKPMERLSINRKQAIMKRFRYLEGPEGDPVTLENVETEWQKLWTLVSRCGAILLCLGFGFLLVTRLLE